MKVSRLLHIPRKPYQTLSLRLLPIMREEAEKNGYELLVMDPDMDVKKQSDQIDDYCQRCTGNRSRTC